ncbi:hypothetical protein, partial [Mesorhizobium sp. M7A.F.Ca.CA.002.07.1.1]|uniref:hypothetical protein n=1 Tax=Mesorhizobium sp. M7A.F.Ca.CA.002.07.1.1 TaxID=2496723 RepID=UPI0019D2891E
LRHGSVLGLSLPFLGSLVAAVHPAGQQFVDSGIFDCSERSASVVDHPEMLGHGWIPRVSWGSAI